MASGSTRSNVRIDQCSKSSRRSQRLRRQAHLDGVSQLNIFAPTQKWICRSEAKKLQLKMELLVSHEALLGYVPNTAEENIINETTETFRKGLSSSEYSVRDITCHLASIKREISEHKLEQVELCEDPAHEMRLHISPNATHYRGRAATCRTIADMSFDNFSRTLVHNLGMTNSSSSEESLASTTSDASSSMTSLGLTHTTCNSSSSTVNSLADAGQEYHYGVRLSAAGTGQVDHFAEKRSAADRVLFDALDDAGPDTPENPEDSLGWHELPYHVAIDQLERYTRTVVNTFLDFMVSTADDAVKFLATYSSDTWRVKNGNATFTSSCSMQYHFHKVPQSLNGVPIFGAVGHSFKGDLRCSLEGNMRTRVAGDIIAMAMQRRSRTRPKHDLEAPPESQPVYLGESRVSKRIYYLVSTCRAISLVAADYTDQYLEHIERGFLDKTDYMKLQWTQKYRLHIDVERDQLIRIVLTLLFKLGRQWHAGELA